MMMIIIIISFSVYTCGQSATVCTACVTTVRAVVVCVGRAPVSQTSLATCVTRLSNSATLTGCTLCVTSTQTVLSLDHCPRKGSSPSASSTRLQGSNIIYILYILLWLWICFWRVICWCRCVCKNGYEGDGQYCTLINPCLTSNRGGCDTNVRRNTGCVCTCVCVCRCSSFGFIFKPDKYVTHITTIKARPSRMKNSFYTRARIALNRQQTRHV